MSDLTLSASTIIKRSILSSIYIDDKISEPFSGTDSTDIQFVTAKGVYESFKREKKSIDFYKFDQNRNWEEDSEYLFRNRDLLVIDWQLIGEELSQPETLKIIKKATSVDSLHFMSIYTTTEQKDFPEIFYQIKAFFNSSLNDNAQKHFEDVISTLEDEGVETKFFDKLKGKFKELALKYGDTRKSVLEELRKEIQTELGDKYRLFAGGLKNISTDPSTACEVFGYILNDIKAYNNWETTNEVKIDFIEGNFILVNHTIIQITNKTEPEPKDLFQFFTDALQKVSGNLLTLITLEIRSLLRESSGFIGKDADGIKDAILFHQQQKKGEFLEFLMSIIKSHTTSYFDYKQANLVSLKPDFWKQYFDEKNIKAELDNYDKADNKASVVEELLKLNVYYNVLHIKRSDGDIVKFGDVFSNQKTGLFFMCITAHCDCLQSENIKNNFYFISGNRSPDAKKLVADGDDVFCSYIKDNNKITAIEWNPKPIVLKISNNRILSNKLKGIDGKDVEYELIYFSTIKENYAQRMANNAFAHAMRVGIDFAKM
jgi:hypothetical protein